jgi:type I restriction enzyme M protein
MVGFIPATDGFQNEAGGSRLAIVFNGSPLFSGGAASGMSEIRR